MSEDGHTVEVLGTTVVKPEPRKRAKNLNEEREQKIAREQDE